MKKILASWLLAMCAFSAHAGVVNGSGFLVNADVDWYSFTNTNAGLVNIYAAQAAPGDFDSVLFLFRDDGSLDTADFIQYDDDGGSGLESLISLVLGTGDYLLAVATHGAWYDPLPIHGGHHGSTAYNLAISGDFVSGNVPEPASIALLGLGLAAFAFRRKQA